MKYVKGYQSMKVAPGRYLKMDSVAPSQILPRNGVLKVV